MPNNTIITHFNYFHLMGMKSSFCAGQSHSFHLNSIRVNGANARVLHFFGLQATNIQSLSTMEMNSTVIGPHYPSNCQIGQKTVLEQKTTMP